MFEDFQNQKDDVFEELEDKEELLLNAVPEQTIVETEPSPEIYDEIQVEHTENDLGINTFASFNSLEDLNLDVVDELLRIPNVEFDFTYDPEIRSYETVADNSENIEEPDIIKNTQDDQQFGTSEFLKVNINDKFDQELAEKLDPELLEATEPSNLSELENQWSDQQNFSETRGEKVEIEEDTHVEADNLETSNYIESDYIHPEKDELIEDLIDELLENFPDEFSTPFPSEEESIHEKNPVNQAEEYTESTIIHHANHLIDLPDKIAELKETELVIEEFLLENEEVNLEDEYKSSTLVEEEKIRNEREWREELVEEKHTPPHFSEYMMTAEEKEADDNEELEDEDGDTDTEDIEEAENFDPEEEREKISNLYYSRFSELLPYPYETRQSVSPSPPRLILSNPYFPSPSKQSNAMYSYFPPPQFDAHQGHAKSTTDNNSNQKKQNISLKIPEDNNTVVVNADVRDKYSKHFKTKLEKFEQGISNTRINKLIFKEDVLKPFWKYNKKSRQNLKSYWSRLLKDNINGLKKLPPFDLTDPNTWPTGVRNKYQELVDKSTRSISDWKKLKQFEIDIWYAINKSNLDSIVSDIEDLGFDISSDLDLHKSINDIYVQINNAKAAIQNEVDEVTSIQSIPDINGLLISLPSQTVGDLTELEALISTILGTRDELLGLTGMTRIDELTRYITARTAHGFSHSNGLDGKIAVNMDKFYKYINLGSNPGPPWKIVPIESKFRTLQKNLDLRGVFYTKGTGPLILRDDGLNNPSLLNGGDIVTKIQRLYASMNQLGSKKVFDSLNELKDYLKVYEQHFDKNLRYNTIMRPKELVAKSPIMYYYLEGGKYVFKHIETKAMKARLKIPLWDIHKPDKPKYTAAQQEKDGNIMWDNAIQKMENLASKNIEIHAFPEGIFSIKAGKVQWDLNRLRDLNADTLNQLQGPYIKNIDQLDILGLVRKYKVIRRIELDVEMPADMKKGITKNQVYYKMKDGKGKVMKFMRGKVDLLELDISIAEYYEMIHNGDFEKIRSAEPSIIIFPNRTRRGRLLSISEKQRLMEDSLDIINGKYYLNLRTKKENTRIYIGKTLDPVNRLEGILCGNYANDGIEKQIYFQATFRSTDQEIKDAHHLRDARELYNNKIHRKNEMLGIQGGETKFRDDGKSISELVLVNIQSYFADEVDRQIEVLNAEIKRIKKELNSNKTLKHLSSDEIKNYTNLMAEYKLSKAHLLTFKLKVSQIFNQKINETRRYKIATENVLRENISAFEKSLENQYVKLERLEDSNQHRLIWDNSGLGIDLPTNIVDEYTITTGNSLEQFFASSVQTIASLNDLMGSDGKAMKNGEILELINQGKIIVIPARKLDTRGTGSIIAGPFILVEDRVLMPNYKLNQDGSQTLDSFRNEPLFSTGVNLKGVSFKFMKKFGEDILFSNRVTLKGVSLGKILEGGGVPSYRRQAEEKISSIPNWNYKSLSVDANQSQKDIQKIFTDHILLMDQKNRLNYLETLSYDEWTKKIERFISIDQKPDKVTMPDALVSNIFSNARNTLRRSKLDRTSVDLLNIRLMRERLDKLLESGLLGEKIVLLGLDNKGIMVPRERTILEIYQRSLVSALLNQRTSTGFMSALATLNLWGQADGSRIAENIADLPVELKDVTFINVRGSYDVNTDKLGIHTLDTRNIIMQDGKEDSIINRGWVTPEDTDLNINNINRFEFSGQSELSIKDAFSSEFALLDRIMKRSATVSEVLESIADQMSFFGLDKKGIYNESSKFKGWWNEKSEQWAILGQDAPNKHLKYLHNILNSKESIDYIAFRLKLQWDILGGLVGEKKYDSRFLKIDGYSASFFARLSK